MSSNSTKSKIINMSSVSTDTELGTPAGSSTSLDTSLEVLEEPPKKRKLSLNKDAQVYSPCCLGLNFFGSFPLPSRKGSGTTKELEMALCEIQASSGTEQIQNLTLLYSVMSSLPGTFYLGDSSGKVKGEGGKKKKGKKGEGGKKKKGKKGNKNRKNKKGRKKALGKAKKQVISEPQSAGLAGREICCLENVKIWRNNKNKVRRKNSGWERKRRMLEEGVISVKVFGVIYKKEETEGKDWVKAGPEDPQEPATTSSEEISSPELKLVKRANDVMGAAPAFARALIFDSPSEADLKQPLFLF